MNYVRNATQSQERPQPLALPVEVDLQHAVPVLREACSPIQGDNQQPVCLVKHGSTEGFKAKKLTLCWSIRPFGSRVLKINCTVASL